MDADSCSAGSKQPLGTVPWSAVVFSRDQVRLYPIPARMWVPGTANASGVWVTCQPDWERGGVGGCVSPWAAHESGVRTVKLQPEHQELAEAVSGACNLAGLFTSPGLVVPSAGPGWLLSKVGPLQEPVLPAGTSTGCRGGVVPTTDHQRPLTNELVRSVC